MSDTSWTDKHQWLSSPVHMVVSAEEVKQFERDCNAKIAALEAENAALRDAGRYRRIRENWIDCDELNLHGRLSVIDAAIDSAINTKEGKE